METDGLATLAEVFIGLAGFSGISLVLRSNPSTYYLFRILVVVGVSMMAIVISLMPGPLLEAGVAENTVWRIGRGLMVATYLVVLPLLLHFRAKASQGLEQMVGPLNTVLLVFTGLIVISQVVNALGLFINYAYALMFFGLLGFFIYCGTLFIISLTVGRSDPN